MKRSYWYFSGSIVFAVFFSLIVLLRESYGFLQGYQKHNTGKR